MPGAAQDNAINCSWIHIHQWQFFKPQRWSQDNAMSCSWIYTYQWVFKPHRWSQDNAMNCSRIYADQWSFKTSQIDPKWPGSISFKTLPKVHGSWLCYKHLQGNQLSHPMLMGQRHSWGSQKFFRIALTKSSHSLLQSSLCEPSCPQRCLSRITQEVPWQ